MDAQDQAEQERTIRDYLRRADRSPQTSTLRRDTLKRLIDLAHSPHASLKIIAAENMQYYIKDFPDLEDEAINAVYDLCEDQVSQVRIKGYAAIVNVSKAQHKWVKRNADVLVQLLQSDEPEEVTFVRRALTQHLDMDPAVTLGVLCDQIVPPDEPMDDEEQSIRDRLRSLVLSFITEDAKRAIVERHTSVPGSPAEEVLVSGLLKAVTRLSPSDIEIIVKEILLALPSFKSDSPRGQQLLDTVLQLARSSSKADRESHPNNCPLTTTRFYLELASVIVVDHHLSDPRLLMQFYSANFISRVVLSKFSQEAQVLVLSHIARVLTACEERTDPFPSAYAFPVDKATPFYNACTVLLQVFSDLESRDETAWTACRVFLKTCVKRKENQGWSVPPTLASVLQRIDQQATASNALGKVDNFADVHELIRSLLQSAPKPAAAGTSTQAPPKAETRKGIVSSSSTSSIPDRRIMNVKRKQEDRPSSLPPRPQTTTTPTSIKGASSTPLGPRGERHPPSGTRPPSPLSQRTGQNSPFTEDQPRAAKRAKKGGGEDAHVPSLLSRMAATNGASAAADRTSPFGTGPQRRGAELTANFSTPRHKPPSDPDKDPVVGFSIRGAAKAVSRPSSNDEDHPVGSSLLDRLQAGEREGDFGSRRGRRRTRNF